VQIQLVSGPLHLQVQSFHRVHGQGNAAHRLVLPHPLAHIAKVISNQAAWKVLGRSRHRDDARRNKREIEVEVVILEPMPPEGSCACRRGSEGGKSIEPADISPWPISPAAMQSLLPTAKPWPRPTNIISLMNRRTCSLQLCAGPCWP
jgi:hypothetical protein